MTGHGLRPRLFSDSVRTDPAPRRHNERLYSFLDRIGRGWHEGVRSTAQSWLDAAPLGYAQRIAREFRSPSDRQCLAAFWELYLFTLWTKLGFDVATEPAVGQSQRLADFLVTEAGRDALVEATVSFDDDADGPAARRLGDAYQALEATDSPNFFLWISVTQGAGPMPSLAPVRRTLEAWLRTLDPDAVAIGMSGGGARANLPNLSTTAGSWTLQFEAIPKSQSSRGAAGIRPLGAFDTGGVRILNTTTRLRSALIAKADQTRAADRPVLVALNAQGFFVDDDDVYATLYGDEAIHFRVGREPQVETHRAIRQPTGFWTEGRLGRRSHVSAVMTVRDLGPWNVHRQNPILWLNPWATRPLELALPFQRVEINLEHGARVDVGATSQIAAVLGLDPDWPAPGGPWTND